MKSLALQGIVLFSVAVTLSGCSHAAANNPADSLDHFATTSLEGWTIAADAAVDPANRQALVAVPGKGVWISTLRGRVEGRNLTTHQTFGDIEAHVEFLLSEQSNAGVKLQGLYEIQLCDSYRTQKPSGDDCGGIYPRAEKEPFYRIIDGGIPPKVNAARPADHWQTLDIIFHAPRFDTLGRKIVNARFIKVVLNGQLIHDNIEIACPTGSAWRKELEVPRGPLYLQGDHGPVAYRNVRIRVLSRTEQ